MLCVINYYFPVFQAKAQEASITYISPPQTKNPDENITFNCTVVKPSSINVSWCKYKNLLYVILEILLLLNSFHKVKDGTMLTLGATAVFFNPRFRITVDDSSNTYSLHV